MRCEEVISEVYALLDGELTAQKRKKILQHLLQCRRCFSYFEFERIFKRLVQKLGARQKASYRLRAGIYLRLREGGS